MAAPNMTPARAMELARHAKERTSTDHPEFGRMSGLAEATERLAVGVVDPDRRRPTPPARTD